MPKAWNPVLCVYLCVQYHLILWNPMAGSPPGSSVHGIFKARILEWVAISFPGDRPNPGIELMSPVSSALAGRFFTTEQSAKLYVPYMWNLKKWYKWTYLQNRNSATDVENKLMVIKGEKKG